MKEDAQKSAGGLSYHAAIQRAEVIRETVASGNKRQLVTMLNHLFRHRPGNAIAIAVQAMGESGRSLCIPLLVDVYGSSIDNEKRLILAALLDLGAFDTCLPGLTNSPRIPAQLWALLGSCNSNQLRSHLALSPEAFQAKLDAAWKITRHWRE